MESKDRTPLVSVGMPVYNGEPFLREAIESVLSQTFEDIELIISDNASEDGTERICREYAKRDGRVRYIRNPKNIGASDNYNAVFLNSRGKYFKWASSNDLCGPDFIRSCVAVLEARPDAVVCCPRTRLFKVSGGATEEYPHDLALEDEWPSARFRELILTMKLNNAMNGVLRSSALRRTALIKTYFSSDMVLMAELALHGKFCVVPEPLFFRRMDEKTTINLKSEEEGLRHYDPEAKLAMVMQNWKILGGHFGAARRAPISLSERARATAFLLRRAIWSRRVLGRDVIDAGRKLYNRTS